jgi:hypothetical protein
LQEEVEGKARLTASSESSGSVDEDEDDKTDEEEGTGTEAAATAASLVASASPEDLQKVGDCNLHHTSAYFTAWSLRSLQMIEAATALANTAPISDADLKMLDVRSDLQTVIQ